jgi:hypothetical protein
MRNSTNISGKPYQQVELVLVSPLTSTYLLSDRVIKLNQSNAATAPPRQETLC